MSNSANFTEFTLEELKADTRFEKYYRLLCEWNSKFNLTSLTEREDVYLKHFFDSVLPHNLFPYGARVLDVGSGAGFPGMCLKLVRPDLDLTLLDSIGKKITFLETTISELSLSGIRAIKSRIEDFKTRDFDVATARAVAPLSILCEYCLPFLRVGGRAVFYKSSDCDTELSLAENALNTLGGKIAFVDKRPLSEDIHRTFIVVDKIKNSHAKYPRGGNKPRLDPL